MLVARAFNLYDAVIQLAGTVKRAEASVMKLASGRGMEDASGSVLALDSKNVNVATKHMKCVITTMSRALSPSDPDHAITSAGARI
jgi:hypothetical protein